jgi:hypothetical protein
MRVRVPPYMAWPGWASVEVGGGIAEVAGAAVEVAGLDVVGIAALVDVVGAVWLVEAGGLEVGDWLLQPMTTKEHTSRIVTKKTKPFICPSSP